MKQRTTWNLKLLYKSDKDPQIEKDRKKVNELCNAFVKKWKKRSDYTKDPAILEKALKEYEYIEENYLCFHDVATKEDYYYYLKQNINQTDPKIKAKYTQATDLSRKLFSDMEFFPLTIARIPKKLHKKFLSSKEIKPYKHYLERLFKQAKYLLSEQEERIINMKLLFAHEKWTQMVSDFLSREEGYVYTDKNKKEKKNFVEIQKLLMSRKKQVRSSAADAMNDILLKNAPVAEAEINAVLGNKKVDDELRGMKRPDEFRFMFDDVNATIVDPLISEITHHFKLSKRFYTLKAKLFKVKRMHYYERVVPYGKIIQKYSYDKSTRIIRSILKDLDNELLSIFDTLLLDGQIDVYPKKGKKDGAFAFSTSSSQPDTCCSIIRIRCTICKHMPMS